MAAIVQSIPRALRRSVALAADLCLPTAVSRNLNWRRPMTRAVRKAFVLRQLSSWNSAAVWVGEPSQFARGRRRQALEPPTVRETYTSCEDRSLGSVLASGAYTHRVDRYGTNAVACRRRNSRCSNLANGKSSELCHPMRPRSQSVNNQYIAF
jgi:hypothetical protein